MALSYRKRSAVWHCRGSVRVGRRIFAVREFSTGCSVKSDAEAVGAAEEARMRAEFFDTGKVIEPVRVVTIHDCIAAHRSRPGSLHPSGDAIATFGTAADPADEAWDRASKIISSIVGESVGLARTRCREVACASTGEAIPALQERTPR
jgi:hypothetical protein